MMLEQLVEAQPKVPTQTRANGESEASGLAHLGCEASKVLARALATAYVINLECQCCRRQT